MFLNSESTKQRVIIGILSFLFVGTFLYGIFNESIVALLFCTFLPIGLITLVYDMVFLPYNFINIIRFNKYLREGRVKIISNEFFPREFGNTEIYLIEIDGKGFSFWLWNITEGKPEYTLSEYDHKSISYGTNYIELFASTFIVKSLKRNTIELFKALRLKTAHSY